MYKSIMYRRWDNQVFKISFEQDDFKCYIKEAILLPNCSYSEAKSSYSYNDLKFILDNDSRGNEQNFVQLMKNDSSEKYWFLHKEFLYYIELECLPDSSPSDAIMISNINDYMNVIQFYRYVALTVRVEAFVDLIADLSEGELHTAAKSTLIALKEDLRLNKTVYTISTHFNRESLHSAVRVIKSVVNEKLKKYIESNTGAYSAQQIYTAIIHSIELYEKGENFLYYRGVGHIVYPELPGSLRGKNRFFEDQYYKLAKTTYPDELVNLTYLDRIAKIQHYGWPSRLMDVTSNPLVALYMACNTIYTKDDPKQKDFGEIIIYFRDELAEKSYDSKSVIIAAALVKLAYQERKAMFEFINMHRLYFQYKCNEIGIKERALRSVFNFCLRIAVQRGVDTILTPEEEQQLVRCIANQKIEFNMCKHPVDYIFRCIQGQDKNSKIKCHKLGEDKRLRFHCGNTDSSTGESRYNYVYTEEIDLDSYKNRFNYFVSAYDRLLVTIRRENIAFENKIDVFTTLRSYHVRLGMTNDRILAQSGSFIIAGLDDLYINEGLRSSRTKQYARIIIEDKKAIFEELKLLNINDSTMLPDLQHTGDYMRDLFT